MIVFGDDVDVAALKKNIAEAPTIKEADQRFIDGINEINNSDKYKDVSSDQKNKVLNDAGDIVEKILTDDASDANPGQSSGGGNADGGAQSGGNADVSGISGETEDADQKLADAKAKAEAAKEKYEEKKAIEQSKENRMLTAATLAATGIGGMELAMGLSEQKADKDADMDMTAHMATMHCTYGDGKQVKAGPEEIELPGGNDATLMQLREEYFALAEDLKVRKTALGMAPGIESEVILDNSEMDLYDDESIGIDTGAYASLYRAKALNSEADQAKIDEEQKASKNRVIAGATVAGVGVVGSMIGDSIINGKLGEKIREGIKNKKVGKETQALLKTEAKALKDLQDCLKSAGVAETDKLTFKEFYPSILSVQNINCKKDLLPITDSEGKKLSTGDKPGDIKASSMFADSTDEEKIWDSMLKYINIETTTKLIGYSLNSTANLQTEISNAKNKIKTSIESIKKKFKEAEDTDKNDAEKSGISIGQVSGFADGDGLATVTSLFNGAKDSNSFDLSSFLKK